MGGLRKDDFCPSAEMKIVNFDIFTIISVSKETPAVII